MRASRFSRCSHFSRALVPVLVLCASLGAVALPASASADDDFARWRLDAGLSFAHFEQQVKAEVGGARGERLVRDSEFGFNLFAAFAPIEYLGIGVYAQIDAGVREMGRFEGIDADGKAVTSGELGGGFWEFWAGPFLRGQWRWLFVEVGYGFGVRGDDGRTDLPDDAGNTDDPLLTSPAVAWLIGGGAMVPVLEETLHVVVRVEYRVRYYDRRTSGGLADDVVHGTQSLAPYVGVAWTP